MEEVCLILDWDAATFFREALPHALPILVYEYKDNILQQIEKRLSERVGEEEKKTTTVSHAINFYSALLIIHLTFSAGLSMYSLCYGYFGIYIDEKRGSRCTGSPYYACCPTSRVRF